MGNRGWLGNGSPYRVPRVCTNVCAIALWQEECNLEMLKERK